MTESHDNLDDSLSNLGNSGTTNGFGSDIRKSKDQVVNGGNGLFNWNLKLKERLFLFAFDLIELNSVFNYIIYTLFILIDFIFLAYYPLN